MSSPKKFFNISIDFEDMHRFSVTIGSRHPHSANENSAFEDAIPRFIDLFNKHNIRATFFMTGVEILKMPQNRNLVRRLTESGHELANHTYSHPFNFSKLSLEQKRQNILNCQKLLEDISGKPVRGFRAPCYDIDEETMDILEENGYLYDSSIYPFYLKTAQQLGYYLWSVCKGNGLGVWRRVGSFSYSFAPKEPYFPDKKKLHLKGDRKILELPIPMAGFFRIPFYSTFIFAYGHRFFNYTFKLMTVTKFFTYELHSIDLVDYTKDNVFGVYPELKGHPAMRQTAEEKIKILDRALSIMKNKFTSITLSDFAKTKFTEG